MTRMFVCTYKRKRALLAKMQRNCIYGSGLTWSKPPSLQTAPKNHLSKLKLHLLTLSSWGLNPSRMPSRLGSLLRTGQPFISRVRAGIFERLMASGKQLGTKSFRLVRMNELYWVWFGFKSFGLRGCWRELLVTFWVGFNRVCAQLII